MLLSLKRDSNVRDFLMQKFPDSANNLLSWIIISLVFCALLAAFIAPFIPVIPVKVRELQLFGYELNKFGFSLVAILIFYWVRNLVSYLFYAGTGSLKKWHIFYFTISKFYFCVSILLMVLCVLNYFYTLDETRAFEIYFVGFSVLFVFKLTYYLSHRNNILPPKWYYKFLYICTLQIVPVLVLWKVLFF